MSVLKDRSNFNNIIQGSRHVRPSDDNIFVSFSTPQTVGRDQLIAQATRTPPIIRLFSEISSDEDLNNSSNSFEEEFGELSSVLLTPTSPKDVNHLTFSVKDSSSNTRPKKKVRVDNEESRCRLSLQNKLQGLSKAQLIDLLETLVAERHPELEEEIHQLVPEPDLQAMESKLKTLKRNIFKSFPHRGSHVGSSRDAYNYRRVQSHIQAFRKECTGQGHNLAVLCMWKTVVEYVLMAWSYIADLPTWDNPAHNNSRLSCFKTLAVQFQQALSNGSFTLQEYNLLQSRLEQASTINKHLEPCLRQVNEILS